MWPAAVPVAIAAVQMVLTGEKFHQRTGLLLLVLWIAALTSWLLVRWLGRLCSRWLPVILASLLVGVALLMVFPVVSLAVFAIENRLIEGHVEAGTFSEWRLRRFLWSLIGAMGLFVPTGLRHTLPYPALGLAFAGTFSFLLWLRRR
jgi:hypothetical protein